MRLRGFGKGVEIGAWEFALLVGWAGYGAIQFVRSSEIAAAFWRGVTQ